MDDVNQQEIAEKPPTLTIGVEGIEAKPMGVIGNMEFKHNWQHLSQIPKFQTFAYEQCQKPYDVVEEWITPFILDHINAGGEQCLFDLYVEWHDQKGYWKNETIYGELIEVE